MGVEGYMKPHAKVRLININPWQERLRDICFCQPPLLHLLIMRERLWKLLFNFVESFLCFGEVAACFGKFEA